MSNLSRSLLFSLVVCFVIPLLGIITLWIMLWGMACLPGVEFIGQMGIDGLKNVLTVFGGGYPLQGLTIIGITCSTVGCLFDLYNFYLYQG